MNRRALTAPTADHYENTWCEVAEIVRDNGWVLYKVRPICRPDDRPAPWVWLDYETEIVSTMSV